MTTCTITLDLLKNTRQLFPELGIPYTDGQNLPLINNFANIPLEGNTSFSHLELSQLYWLELGEADVKDGKEEEKREEEEEDTARESDLRSIIAGHSVNPVTCI